MIRLTAIVLLISLFVLSSNAQDLNEQGELKLPKISRPLHYHKSVMKLIDKSFEKETQASTGMTTGSWLIWFHIRGDDSTIEGDMPDDEFWQSHNVVLGSVNADLLSGETMERFAVTKEELPVFLYLHKHKLYRYPKHPKYSWVDLEEFVTSSYQTVTAEPIPPPMTEMQRFLKQMAGPTGLPLRIGLIFIFVVFILYTSLISYFTGAPVKAKRA